MGDQGILYENIRMKDSYYYSQVPYVQLVVPFRTQYHLKGAEHLGLDPLCEVLVEPTR